MRISWMKRQQLVGYLFIAPNMLGILLFFFLPAMFSLAVTFTDWQFTTRSASFVGFDNFIRLFQDPVFYDSLTNTLVFLAAVPLSIFLAFIVAVLLNQSVYLKNMLRAMYFLPYITSGVAVAFVWMLLFHAKDGPINAFLRSIGIANPPGWFSTIDTPMFAFDMIWVWFLLGYNMIIYLAALQEISPELLEAAKIDGAKRLTTIRHILLPLVSPTTLFLLITGFITTVKAFGIIEAITHGGPGTSSHVLSLFVYKTAFRYYEMGYAAAISWILFLLIMIITVIQWAAQKKWVHY
ncbi:sugar ABC transporter permease [Paenibacillus sp. PL2-23]|uniref:carbohydrate ABC transporter permease n=1 Tax=Paenibacillus sp. PL2-23 TaxID=2100729 RepID=UPI0030F96F09